MDQRVESMAVVIFVLATNVPHLFSNYSATQPGAGLYFKSNVFLFRLKERRLAQSRKARREQQESNKRDLEPFSASLRLCAKKGKMFRNLLFVRNFYDMSLTFVT